MRFLLAVLSCLMFAGVSTSQPPPPVLIPVEYIIIDDVYTVPFSVGSSVDVDVSWADNTSGKDIAIYIGYLDNNGNPDGSFYSDGFAAGVNGTTTFSVTSIPAAPATSSGVMYVHVSLCDNWFIGPNVNDPEDEQWFEVDQTP